MAVKEKELGEESKEEKEEKDTGVYVSMARAIKEAKEAPPEEGV